MLIVGLTGGIGSGKSSASELFEQLGVQVIDADIVAREVVEFGSPALNSISEHFGSDILDKQGALDRSKLREIIFSNPDQKDWLEKLLHPIIREQIISQLGLAQSPYAILVSPLLFETDQHELVTRTLLIDIPIDLQIKRASKRDDANAAQIQKIIASQLPRQCKIDQADDIICNDQDLEHLKQRVEKQHTCYLTLASEQ